MSKPESHWKHVAALSDVPMGESKAVRLEEGRSVALFNVDGRIYATDNQCPHMGYPLTRGVVRDGILTCDWHGRSFDLEGGGCFNYECDNLQTFPVDVRQNEIWIQPGDTQYKRRDEHLRLLEDRERHRQVVALPVDLQVAGLGVVDVDRQRGEVVRARGPRQHRCAGSHLWERATVPDLG